MATYRIEWKPRAERDLTRIDAAIGQRIVAAVAKLADDPVPAASKKLLGAGDAFRLRVGDYRVVYTIRHGVLIIEIIHVAHRRDVYRG